MGDVPHSGSILFRCEEIAGLRPHEIARKGLGYVPENRDIFPGLTVRENLVLGMKSTRRAGRWALEDMFELFPLLRERAGVLGGVLSGGEQQMLTSKHLQARFRVGVPGTTAGVGGCAARCVTKTRRGRSCSTSSAS